MQATYIEVSAEVRYWEDATIDGVPDDLGTLVPFRQGDLWCPVIRLSDGAIDNWPEGTTADIHYKVADQGEYWLLDEQKRPIAKWRGHYVPNDFLCHGDTGYGDYIIFKVGADGVIEQWIEPTIDPVDWEPLATSAEKPDLVILDRPGVLPKASMRALFEASVRQTDSLSKIAPLDPVVLEGEFSHYADATTDRLWVGFALGMRCAERLTKN